MLDNFNTTADLNVGDKVYADFSRYGRCDVREGTVIRKSPTGVVKVDFETASANYSFMANGAERGGSKWESKQLITKARYDRLRSTADLQRRERAAGVAIKNAGEIVPNADNKKRLIEALSAALKAAEAL